ncbi:MAG: sulfatase-like hydrolase/transferase [Gemmatimonadetes bacterium]|nr:sulfatase-like hydrolase/transferase [Gemmatimonadota bacterium]
MSLTKAGHGQSAYQVHDEDVAVATVDFLNRLGVKKRAGQPAEPFSLSVGLMLPHQPFVARREDYAYYYDNMFAPKHPEPFGDHLHPHIKQWRADSGIEDPPEEEIRRARAAYWALVERMDILIGQMLTALRENGLEENTLVIYMSDHGEQVGEHGLWWKQTFYEDSVKVPAILSWPGHLPEGTRCGRVTSSLDLNATMIDALGCPALPASRGRSLLPLLTENAPWDDVAFSELCYDAAGGGGPFPEKGVYQRMIRRGPWKLVYYHNLPCQLFNLEKDPHELNDCAGDPACQDQVRTLTAEVLDGWDPEWISSRLDLWREERPILGKWTRTVQPSDQYRWDLRPEMDYLDDDQMGA